MPFKIRMMLLAAALPALGGCYTYTLADRSAVAPGATVRVSLSRDEAVRHIDALGNLRERMEGQVQAQSDASTLALTVRRTDTPADGGRFNAFVSLPWTGVTQVEVKRFSPKRTGLAVVGAGALGYGLLTVLEAVTQGEGREGPTPDEAVRIPLLRLRW